MVRAQRRRQSRVSAHKTTILHEGICSSTFLFRICRRRKRPPAENGGGGRYAPVTLDIRSQWHHRGAYLYANVEICAADPWYTPSVASCLCLSPLKSPVAVNVEKHVVLQILHSASGFVQDDKGEASSIVTREGLRLWQQGMSF